MFLGGGGRLFGAALVLIIVESIWVLGHMVPFFYLMNHLGLLRVDEGEERTGLDVSHHGGAAYEATGTEILAANIHKANAPLKNEEIEKMSARCTSPSISLSVLVGLCVPSERGRSSCDDF